MKICVVVAKLFDEDGRTEWREEAHVLFLQLQEAIAKQLSEMTAPTALSTALCQSE